MPTSFSVPVVAPEPRWARKPRSGPLQRSSASPIAATGATAGIRERRRPQPTSGSRRPRWLTACGPQASTRSASWRPRCAKPARSRPVARCSSVELDLLHLEPGAHGVDRHPRLDAEAHRDREHGGTRARPSAGAGRRAARAASKPAAQPDQRAGRPPSRARSRRPTRARERGDREIGVRLGERAQVAAEVGVAEEERAGLELPARRASAPGPCRAAASLITRAPPASATAAVRVARAVVGDDDRGVGELLAAALDRLADPLLLVAGGDEDGEPVAHRCAAERRDRRQHAVRRRCRRTP